MEEIEKHFIQDGKKYNIEEMKKFIVDYEKLIFSDLSGRHVRMEEVLPKEKSIEFILDYGCGWGCISNYFAQKYNCQVDAVDISKDEISKALLVYEDNPKIKFIAVEDFSFPKEHYDLIFSSQVIEHVHNPGLYLSRINEMLKDEGSLVIGLPNIVNKRGISLLKHYNNSYAVKHSKNMIQNYNKGMDHINGWDPHHFIILAASCGFELEQYIPTEGVPRHIMVDIIPMIGKIIGRYGDRKNKMFSKNLSYTMFFRFKKVKSVKINEED